VAVDGLYASHDEVFRTSLSVQGGSNMTGTDFFVNKTKLTCASKCLVIMVF
jgi:hypothetical protein